MDSEFKDIELNQYLNIDSNPSHIESNLSYNSSDNANNTDNSDNADNADNGNINIEENIDISNNELDKCTCICFLDTLFDCENMRKYISSMPPSKYKWMDYLKVILYLPAVLFICCLYICISIFTTIAGIIIGLMLAGLIELLYTIVLLVDKDLKTDMAPILGWIIISIGIIGFIFGPCIIFISLKLNLD